MFKRHITSLFTLSLLTASLFVQSSLSERNINLCKGIAPKNNLWIGTNIKSNSEVTEEYFNSIMDKITDLYAPMVEAAGGKLVIQGDWDDGTVNAYASQRGANTWLVQMFGGLARYENMTKDGFAMVICHELGHHLGGAPKKDSYWGKSWASNEGQADYFATLKCARRLFADDDNANIVSSMNIDPLVVDKCQENFKDANEQNVCIRAAMAGKVLASVLNSLGHGENPVEFNTPDNSVVSRTDDSHPAAQCRLDTYFSGSVCHVSYGQNVDDDDPTIGTCARINGDIDGVRPLCWYKPEE